MAKDTNRAGGFQKSFQGKPQYNSWYFMVKNTVNNNTTGDAWPHFRQHYYLVNEVNDESEIVADNMGISD